MYLDRFGFRRLDFGLCERRGREPAGKKQGKRKAVHRNLAGEEGFAQFYATDPSDAKE
jgi:hypothetical protein